MKKVITLLALLSVAVFAQNTFTDPRDGKKYKYVKIGKQTWMAQNLDYRGRDGYLGLCYGDIPKEKIKRPENCEKYGRLYDREEADEACPKGWRLPTHDEWKTLIDFAGGEGTDGTAGKKLRAKSEWKEEKCKWTEEKMDNRGRVTVKEYDVCATDEYGFSALPGGYGFVNGYFEIGENGYWWSIRSDDEGYSYYIYFYKTYYITYSYLRHYAEEQVFSVRCVRN